MKTVGKTIKEARVKKKLSKEKLEKETKIKKEFIDLIEKEIWEKLPEYPVVVGFVKKISSVLALNEKHVVALLRRDYPPKILRVNPKPDVSSKFTWSPRLTFLAGIILVMVIILGYLGIQYVHFVSPPQLEITVPTDSQVVREENLRVVGKTNPGASVLVNNQPVIVSDNGEFSAEIEIFEGTEEVTVIARSRSGKETVIRRKIIPELGGK